MLEKPPVQYTREADAHIAYQVVGDGPIDVLVAPGFISHLDLQWTMPSFVSYIERLTAFSRVILFDKRSTGLSDGSLAGARFDQRVDDIEAVLNATGSERAVVLGMSEGGPIAAAFAASRPDRVHSLILLNTFAAGSSIERETIDRFSEAVGKWGEGMTADIFMSPQTVRTITRSYFGLFERASCSPGMANALFNWIKDIDVRALLPSITTPVLLLHQKDDPFAQKAWTDEMEELMPDAERIELDGAEHLPWLGDSAPLAAAIGEFVTGEPTEERGHMVASVLFTDIVDSTKNAVEMGDHEWRILLMKHNELVRSLLFEYRGQEIKQTGDGFLALFSTPGRAVRCAEAIVHAVSDLGIEIRAGVHSGEVQMMDAADVAGLTVHWGARVGAQAGASQVMVSKTARDLLVADDLQFVTKGLHSLKGIPGEIELFLLLDDRGPTLDVTEERIARPLDRLAINTLRTIAKARQTIARAVAPAAA
jgi:pimeloyl-ACP methyl ester carboxylesterase